MFIFALKLCFRILKHDSKEICLLLLVNMTVLLFCKPIAHDLDSKEFWNLHFWQKLSLPQNIVFFSSQDYASSLMINGEETLPNLRAIITTDLTSKAGEFLCLSVTKHNKFQKQTKYMEKRENEKFYFLCLIRIYIKYSFQQTNKFWVT